MPSPWQKWKAVNKLRRDFFLAVEEDPREHLLSICGFIYQSSLSIVKQCRDSEQRAGSSLALNLAGTQTQAGSQTGGPRCSILYV